MCCPEWHQPRDQRWRRHFFLIEFLSGPVEEADDAPAGRYRDLCNRVREDNTKPRAPPSCNLNEEWGGGGDGDGHEMPQAKSVESAELVCWRSRL